MSPRNEQRPVRLHRGASLIEVMAAILVICLGLLGMARLSSATIGHNKSAQARMVGQSLVRMYTERARLNVYGFDLGAYDVALDEVPPQAQALDADAADDGQAAVGVAKEDKREFLALVAASLPAGRAVVTSIPGAAARDLDVWLLWSDPQMEADASLAEAARRNCPATIDPDRLGNASCMYFRAGL